MQKENYLKKYLALVLCFLLTFTNCYLLNINLISYAQQVLNSQEISVEEADMEFDVFFKQEDANTHYLKSDINQINNMYVYLNVKSGYLKNAKIELLDSNNGTDLNYSIEKIESEQIVQEVEQNTIMLKQIYNQKEKMFIIPIKYLNQEYVDVNNISKQTKAKLTGTYINNDGEQIKIEKQIDINISWEMNYNLNLNSQILRYINFNNGTKDMVLIQQEISSSLNIADKQNKLPIKKTDLQIQIQKINGYLPESVSVMAEKLENTNGMKEENINFSQNNWEYNEQTNILNINVENQLNNSKAYSKIGEDVFIITYIYPAQIIENLETPILLNTNAQANISIYDNTNIQNKLEKQDELLEKIGELVEYEINTNITDISKGKIYANSLTQTPEYIIEYEKEWKVDIAETSQIQSIMFTDINDKFVTEEDKFDVNTTYTQTKISKTNFENILGEDGYIKILDSTNVELTTIDKNTQTNDLGEYVIQYQGQINNVNIQTSTLKNIGTLIINHTKQILPEQKYEKDLIKTFSKIQLELSGKVQYIGMEEYAEISKKQAYINLNETTTNAQISIDKNNLSAITKNENVELKIELNDDKEMSDLYINPTFDIILPDCIEQIEIKDTQILYNEDLKIKNVEALNNNGINIIRITLEGQSSRYSLNTLTKGTNIILNTNIKIKTLTSNRTTSIELNYYNPNATNYTQKIEEIGYSKVDIQTFAPTGLLSISTITGFDDTGKSITSVEQGEIIEKIKILQPAKTANMRLTLMNNNPNICSQIISIGRIPFKDNKDVKTNENLGTTVNTILKSVITPINIDPQNVTIYYSENPEANIDLNNEQNLWTTTPNDLSLIKSYLIVLNNYELQVGEVVEFAYDFEIPEGLKHNNYIFGSFGVSYINNTELALISEISVADKVGLTTGQGPELELDLSVSPENGQTIMQYQRVKYTAKIKNTGKVTAYDINVKSIIPENAIYTEYVQTSLQMGKYKQDSTKKELTFNIDELEVGQTKTVEFYLQITDLGEEAKISNNVTLTAKDLSAELQSNTVENPIIEAPFMLSIESEYAQTYALREDVEFHYYISVINNTEELQEQITLKTYVPEGLVYLKLYQLQVDQETGKTTQIDLNATYDETSREVTYIIPSLEASSAFNCRMSVLTGYIKGEENSNVVSTKISAKSENTELVYSNEWKNVISRPKLSITQSSNPTNKYIKEGDELDYIFTIKNQGDISATLVKLKDTIPEELEVQSATYKLGDVTRGLSISKDNNLNLNIGTINKEDVVEITIKTKVKKLQDGINEKEISNIAVLSATNVAKINTDNLVKIIEINPQYNQEDSSTSNTPNNSNKPTTNQTKKYNISGIAWLDENKNGKRDTEEQLLKEITVKLVSSNNSTIIAETKTNQKGEYIFTGLDKSSYFILFEYDTNSYELTEYKKEGIKQNLNSDVIQTKVNQNGVTKVSGITDTIEIEDVSISNIDIGFIMTSHFNLKLEKEVTNITIQNNGGTTTHNYSNTTLAKAEIAPIQLSSSTVIMEYEITVTNIGSEAGYAKKIVDYIPQGTVFESDLNPHWYLGNDDNAYSSILADVVIKPGESKKIKLILTKKMTENNLGVISNTAEIYETYNEKGLKDINSKEANSTQGEDDIDNADILLSIKTGKTGIYIILALSIVTIITLGIYGIRKKVLERF